MLSEKQGAHPRQHARPRGTADRTPQYSAVFYSQTNGEALRPVIDLMLDELRRKAGIQVYCVHLRTAPELLWQRISARLAREPSREHYNEGSREWMDKTFSWYDSQPWDYVIDNNDATVQEVMLDMMHRLGSSVPRFTDAVRATTPSPVPFPVFHAGATNLDSSFESMEGTEDDPALDQENAGVMFDAPKAFTPANFGISPTKG